MTQTPWLTGDPAWALRDLKGASQRKLRLFACACLRAVWGALKGEGLPPALLVAERFAEGQADCTELTAVREAPWAPQGPWRLRVHPSLLHVVGAAVRAPTSPAAWSAAANAANTAARIASLLPFGATPEAELAADPECGPRAADLLASAQRQQCELLHDVFGEQPDGHASFDPDWLVRNGGAAGHLARAIDAGAAFADMPVLGDALEDAGCAEPAVLEHCRADRRHARGCWVLDLLLGKG